MTNNVRPFEAAVTVPLMVRALLEPLLISPTLTVRAVKVIPGVLKVPEVLLMRLIAPFVMVKEEAFAIAFGSDNVRTLFAELPMVMAPVKLFAAERFTKLFAPFVAPKVMLEVPLIELTLLAFNVALEAEPDDTEIAVPATAPIVPVTFNVPLLIVVAPL